MFRSFQKGFTLVELMIVIAIIGILAAALYPSLTGYIERSRVAVFRHDGIQTTKVLQLLMMEQGQSLREITNNGCTDCLCRKSGFVPGWRNDGFNGNTNTTPTTDICYIKTTYMWRQLRAVSGVNFAVPFRDPWGGMYTIDENFGEFPTDKCRYDTFISAGNDNIRSGFDDIRTGITGNIKIDDPGNTSTDVSSYKPGTVIKAGNDYAMPLDFPTTCQ